MRTTDTSRQPRPGSLRTRRRPGLMALAGLVCAGLVGCGPSPATVASSSAAAPTVTTTATAAATDTPAATPTAETILMEDAAAVGDYPFLSTPDESGDPAVVDGPSSPGTDSLGHCDPARLIAYLAEHPDAAAAWTVALYNDPGLHWSGGSRIGVDQISAYVGELAPVVLDHDVRVTNYFFRDGNAVAFQSDLRPGTAVLVDSDGTPRVRCACGNPLNPPTRQPPPPPCGHDSCQPPPPCYRYRDHDGCQPPPCEQYRDRAECLPPPCGHDRDHDNCLPPPCDHDGDRNGCLPPPCDRDRDRDGCRPQPCRTGEDRCPPPVSCPDSTRLGCTHPTPTPEPCGPGHRCGNLPTPAPSNPAPNPTRTGTTGAIEPTLRPDPPHHRGPVPGTDDPSTDGGRGGRAPAHQYFGTENPVTQGGRTTGERTDHHPDQTVNNEVDRTHDRGPLSGRS